MAVVWFIDDTNPNTSPYARGYVEGYKDAMKKHKGEWCREVQDELHSSERQTN